MTQKPKTCPTGSMLTYSLGECANSLVMNGIFGFAMLFYTKSLGLDPTWAGLAMSLSVFWEAVTEPVMGHISDNTRSSWGRRHPYILIGGLLMALCFYLIWTVPDFSRGSQMGIFWYLVAMNLLLRTVAGAVRTRTIEAGVDPATLSWMPVRLVIHSSLVSRNLAKSWSPPRHV